MTSNLQNFPCQILTEYGKTCRNRAGSDSNFQPFSHASEIE